jgi:hypothetical protein
LWCCCSPAAYNDFASAVFVLTVTKQSEAPMRTLTMLLASSALTAQAWADTVIATPTVATAPSSTTVDLTNVANALLSLAAAAIVAAISAAIPLLFKRFGIANTTALQAQVTAAATEGAGLIYDYATKHEGGLANVDVRNEAWAIALQHMADKVGPAIASLGYTDQTVANMVHGAVGTLLANDATVTAGAPPQTPAPPSPVPAPIPVHIVANPPVILPPGGAGAAGPIAVMPGPGGP